MEEIPGCQLASSCHVTLGKTLPFPWPQFPHVYGGGVGPEDF